MKTSVKIIACMLFVFALLAVSCGSPQTEEAVVAPEEATASNPLVGVWKITEITGTGPEAETITDPQPGFFIFTKKYLSNVGVSSNTPRPELPENPTDAQLLEAWRPFDAGVGTYEVDGNTMTTHSLVTKNPNRKPSDFWSGEFRIEGDDLFITGKANQDGPIENPYTLKLVRVE
jgi:hypothetical protein